MKLLEERFGSIYLHGHIVEDLMFILKIEKDNGDTSLYKYGDKIYRQAHLDKISVMKDFIDIVSFSFGEWHEQGLSKAEQISIIQFLVDYKGHPLTKRLGLALKESNDEELIETFKEILKIMERESIERKKD